MRRLRAIWAVLWSKGYYVSVKHRDGCTYRYSREFPVKSAGAVLEDVVELINNVATDGAVQEVNSILNNPKS